jgi:hypothetical protein
MITMRLAERLPLDSDAEKQVWTHAWELYGDSLSAILREALATYKRAAGFDDLTRVYESTTGRGALLALKRELSLRWPRNNFGQSHSCVELRSRLRSYLSEYLLRRIVLEQQGASSLRDALFAGDLGL